MNRVISIITGFVLFLTTFCPGSLLGQVTQWEEQLKKDPENRELLLMLGKYYHNMGGTQEDREAVEKAEKYLAKLLEIDPENGVALVYYGSVLTMKAREAFFPWTKMKFMKKGFARMDKAVYFEPDNPEIRLIRGINSVSVPDMFHRLSMALEDFAHIEKLAQKNSSDMTKRFWLPYYYYYGLALAKNKEFDAAKGKFMKAIEIDPESEYARRARQELGKR